MKMRIQGKCFLWKLKKTWKMRTQKMKKWLKQIFEVELISFLEEPMKSINTNKYIHEQLSKCEEQVKEKNGGGHNITVETKGGQV